MLLPTPIPLRDAETEHVWVIVPFSRPENLSRVIENFTRQKFPFKKLMLVANGRAREALEKGQFEVRWADVLTSEQHQSAAKNTALSEIRKRGGGFTVVMDDDDYYGSQFLTEACGYARTYEIIGKGRHFVSVDGSLWLCSRERANRISAMINGGTIACWAENAPEYPHLASGEDTAFCYAAERQGMKVFGTDLYNCLYRRESKTDHTWRFSSEELRRYESACGALDLGAEDLDVINGTKLEVSARLLGPREDADTLSPPPTPGAHHGIA
jgi:hypothetical protein